MEAPMPGQNPEVVPIPWFVSTDDHVMEPAHLWLQWLPDKFKDRAPRIETARVSGFERQGIANFRLHLDDNGTPASYWVYEGKQFPMRRNFASVGLPVDLRDNVPITFEDMRPGCYKVSDRLADMDIGHVEASLCFPSFARFCGQTFLDASDKELALACVRAYNDFMVEEWAGESGGRLVPICLVPLWDAELAAAEIRRNAARGVHAVAFSEIPAMLGVPSIHSGYWDPFFAACAETETVVCMHIGSSSTSTATSADAPMGVTVTMMFANAATSLTDYLMSGLLHRYPGLKLAYSEGQIGWIPYVLERSDDVWRQHRAWAGISAVNVPEPPSTYYYRQVFGCFFRDQHGLDSLDIVGVDNVTLETDYPHTDSTWPDTLDIVREQTRNLDAATVHKLVRGNAIRMLSLDLDR